MEKRSRIVPSLISEQKEEPGEIVEITFTLYGPIMDKSTDRSFKRVGDSFRRAEYVHSR